MKCECGREYAMVEVTPKFDISAQRKVFDLDRKKWGMPRTVNLPDETYDLQYMDGGCRCEIPASRLTTTPTWLQEFGDSKEGREQLALELVRGNRKVEWLGPKRKFNSDFWRLGDTDICHASAVLWCVQEWLDRRRFANPPEDE